MPSQNNHHQMRPFYLGHTDEPEDSIVESLGLMRPKSVVESYEHKTTLQQIQQDLAILRKRSDAEEAKQIKQEYDRLTRKLNPGEHL